MRSSQQKKRLGIKIDGKFEQLKKPRRICQCVLDIFMNMQQCLLRTLLEWGGQRILEKCILKNLIYF